MMVNTFEAPRDPVELARVRAEGLSHGMFDHTIQDERTLAELDYAATQLEFVGQRFFIDASKSLVLPLAWIKGEPVSYTDFHGLMLEGEFATYSRVSIGRLQGSTNTVRALCIGIRDALLLPLFDTVPSDSLVHVPVLAVNSIDKTN